MRDAWTKEEDRQLAWLAQERQALAAERGKLQIFNRLKIGDDESSKIEVSNLIKLTSIIFISYSIFFVARGYNKSCTRSNCKCQPRKTEVAREN